MASKLMLRLFSTFFPAQKPLLFTGVQSSQKLADLLVAGGSRKPLIVTGGFLSRSNAMQAFVERLKTAGCDVSVFDGVRPNPDFAAVNAGLDITASAGCDGVVAIGGGSAIDTAKVIAAASTNGRNVARLAGVLKLKAPPLPFYAVPTTSGTGSEATTAAVISESETHKKRFFVDPKYVPVAAALDPEFLVSLPPHVTAATGMDALTHAIEAYTSRNNFPDSDRDARLAVKLLFEFLPTAYSNGSDIKAREMVALAAFLAGYAFTRSSLGYVHAISHQLSAHYNTPHGLANAIILPRVLRFNQHRCADRYAELDTQVARHDPTDSALRAESFIARIERLSNTLRIPTGLPDLRREDFDNITKNALAEARSSYAVPQKMNRRDVYTILESITVDQEKSKVAGRSAA